MPSVLSQNEQTYFIQPALDLNYFKVWLKQTNKKFLKQHKKAKQSNQKMDKKYGETFHQGGNRGGK